MIKRILVNTFLLFNSCYSFVMPLPPLKSISVSNKPTNYFTFANNNKCINLLNNYKNIKTPLMLKKNRNDFNSLDDYRTYLFILFIICIIRNYVLVMTTLKFIKLL